MEVGIDIVNISRFNNLENKQTFLKRVYTTKELEILKNLNYKPSKAAGLFAAKEAFLKALGVGINGLILLNEIQINYDSLGKPYLELLNDKLKIVNKMGFKEIKISISHTKTLAQAICILN